MELTEYVQEKENELSRISGIRDFNEILTRKYHYRDDNEIDYARIIYSSAFRRLQGKMQLFIPDSIHFYRNRLTHSMEVAQISKCIARKIGMKDLTTVCSCSLAHDIGNPPFGHAGEIALSDVSKKIDFEGNAQTFRVLDHLEEKHHDHNGLNLSLRTLMGIVKYPRQKIENTNKYLYDNDYKRVMEWSKAFSITLNTIDCEIMDVSDEIAYAAHDLEDALRLRYFTIDDILYEFEKSDFYEAIPFLKNVVDKAMIFGKKSQTYDSSEEYSTLFKKELTSLIVDILINDIGLVSDKNGNSKIEFTSLGVLAEGLKKLTFRAIKRNPDIYRYELMGEKVLRGLYEVYTDTSLNKDLKLLPAEYRGDKSRERTVIDYIAGMMDSYAISQYKIYYGKNDLDNIYY